MKIWLLLNNLIMTILAGWTSESTIRLGWLLNIKSILQHMINVQIQHYSDLGTCILEQIPIETFLGHFGKIFLLISWPQLGNPDIIISMKWINQNMFQKAIIKDKLQNFAVY